MKPGLLFIYNADSGFAAGLFDSAHKLLSPQTYQCNLCALTHGLAGQKKEWSAFLKTVSIPLEFWHRDEFSKRAEKSVQSTLLPAIFYRSDDGNLTLVADGKELSEMKSLKTLIECVKSAIRKNSENS
jgi:hypothetical protein